MAQSKFGYKNLIMNTSKNVSFRTNPKLKNAELTCSERQLKKEKPLLSIDHNGKTT